MTAFSQLVVDVNVSIMSEVVEGAGLAPTEVDGASGGNGSDGKDRRDTDDDPGDRRKRARVVKGFKTAVKQGNLLCLICGRRSTDRFWMFGFLICFCSHVS